MTRFIRMILMNFGHTWRWSKHKPTSEPSFGQNSSFKWSCAKWNRTKWRSAKLSRAKLSYAEASLTSSKLVKVPSQDTQCYLTAIDEEKIRWGHFWVMYVLPSIRETFSYSHSVLNRTGWYLKNLITVQSHPVLSRKPKAVFLVMCNPSVNKLWATYTHRDIFIGLSRSLTARS